MGYDIPKGLKELRKKLGLSQEELAEKMNVSKSKISRYERGVSQPDMPFLLQLSNITRKPIGDIIKFNGRSRLDSPIFIPFFSTYIDKYGDDFEKNPYIQNFLYFNHFDCPDIDSYLKELDEKCAEVFEEFR